MGGLLHGVGMKLRFSVDAHHLGGLRHVLATPCALSMDRTDASGFVLSASHGIPGRNIVALFQLLPSLCFAISRL